MCWNTIDSVEAVFIASRGLRKLPAFAKGFGEAGALCTPAKVKNQSVKVPQRRY